MKAYQLTFALLAAIHPFCSMGQMTTNVLGRVLEVRVNPNTPHDATATAFTIDVDGREYLITAKHVVAGLKDRDQIDIYKNDNWLPITVTIFRCDEPVDIAVLVPPQQLTVNFDLPFDNLNFQMGQEAYFLGFPYGFNQTSSGVNGPYPFAMVKRGTISAMLPIDRAKSVTMILLDGYNNPGFSGGPIVYRDFSQSGYVMKVAGVVSGFIPEVVPVLEKHPLRSRDEASEASKEQPWRVQQNKDGSWFEYLETGKYAPLNTGIVQGYWIQPAIDLIRKHPVGPEVKSLTAIP